MICQRSPDQPSRGVVRMRVFGSATGDLSNDARRDIDLLVKFAAGVVDSFDAYFGLKEDLEEIIGRRVDLVMTDAVRNPYFEAGALATDRIAKFTEGLDERAYVQDELRRLAVERRSAPTHSHRRGDEKLAASR